LPTILTTDGGVRWFSEKVCSPPGFVAVALATTGPSDPWALCLGGASMSSSLKSLVRSTDGGKTWKLVAADRSLSGGTPLPVPAEDGDILAIPSPTRLWMMTVNSFFGSLDGGKIWFTVHDVGSDGAGTFASFSFVSGTDGWLLAPFSGLWRTTDGKSWHAISAAVPGHIEPALGLAGNGMAVRTILYSLRAASPSRTTAKPTGIVTGVVQACAGVQVPAGEIIHVKVSLYSGSKRVASETVVSGTKYRFLGQSWDVPPDRLVGFQGCDSTGRSQRHCQLLEPLHLGRATVRVPTPSGLRGSMVTVKVRVLVAVVMTVTLAACTSSQTVAPTTATGIGALTGTANLSSLERQELTAANRAWAGVGSSNLPSLVGPAVQLSGAGFVDGDAKLAFVSGRVTPPPQFPPSPVRYGHWAIISAQQAFHLSTPSVEGTYGGPPDRVLRVQLGSDIWETAHGTMRLPAWLFTVSGLKGTVSVLALSPSDQFHPRHVSEPRPGPNVSVTSAVLGDRGRTLTIGFVGGQIGTKGCDDTYQARVVQEKAIIVVFVAETRVIPSGLVCSAVGYWDHLSVKLSKPIGGRVLVDGVSASAVPLPQ
jgi:hypothetical protein